LAKLDRYILSRLMGPVAIFALILTGIYWVVRAIGRFDELIGDGQSVGVFLKFMVLFLPQVIAIVLPVVSFAAAIFVSNQMHSDSEMVVFQSTGVAPVRLLQPYIIFGVMISLFAGLLSHYLVPLSLVQLEQTKRELSDNVAARLIVGGKFIHPSDNVTFFVEDVKPDGSLQNIFLFDQRQTGRDVTYTAHKAILFRTKDDSRLVMFDGLIQTFDKKRASLSKVQFDEFVFDIGTLTGAPTTRPRQIMEYSTLQLLWPTTAMLKQTETTAAEFKMAAHQRIEQPLQSLVYPMIGMVVLMLGSFSRFGVVRQVIAAVVIVVLLSTISVPLRDIVRGDIRLWPLIYLPDALGLLAVWAILKYWMRQKRPRRHARSTPREVAA